MNPYFDTLNEDEKKKFETYYEELIKVNENMNLTAITEKNDVFDKHFFDSIQIKDYLKGNESILDVGSGAGFPSLPLKILFPNLKVTIVDSLQKRINFLNELVKKLELKDVRLIHSRIEDFKEKESFDLVTARAVARQNILNEFCIPFVKINGLFIAMKGSNYEEELNESLNGIKELGGTLLEVKPYLLGDHYNNLVVIKKTSKTKSMYPRKMKDIKQKPL